MNDDLSIYEQRAADLAATHAREARRHLASGHARECTLCATPEVDGSRLDYYAGAELAIVDCPDCGYGIRVARVFVRVSGDGEWSISETRVHGCGRAGCRPRFRPRRGSTTLDEYVEFTLPLARMFNLRIEDHHVSYVPEITIPVCSMCHGRIHRDSGESTRLQADMSRSEWEAL